MAAVILITNALMLLSQAILCAADPSEAASLHSYKLQVGFDIG